jgi:hypothetical protein
MSTSSKIGAWLHLTKLFLRQFLENDLVSTDSDRAQLIAVVGASVISLTLFISMFLSAPYAMAVLTPGEAAIRTLNDKFFYISLAMLLTALVAASQWDALALDQRDAAILDPLPVPPSIVRWSKLTAVAMLGAAVAVAVNVFPTWVFPWMLSFSLRQMAATDVFELMAIHAMITVTAAAFGYLAVMAVRETLSAVMGPKLFTRLSPTLQASTIVVLGSLLFLLPPASTRVAQRGFNGWWAQLPSMSFVAAYEIASNSFLDDLPRRRVTARMAARDVVNSRAYQERKPLFLPMAQRVQWLMGTALVVLVVATIVNGFRAPVGSALLTAGARRRSPISQWVAALLLIRHPAARAGFHFALATLFRNKTHRLTLACAAAAALAMALFVLSRVDLQPGQLTTGVLVIQPLLYGSLLVGFRHLVRVPAELRANWAVQLAWHDHPRLFTDGVSRAGIVALAVPSVLIVVPLVSLLAGTSIALAHAALGLAGSIVLMEALMVGYDKAPFVCNYVPGSGKIAVPVLALAFLIGANRFASMELSILGGENVTRHLLVLVVLFAGFRIAATRRRRPQVDFNEGAEGFRQLGLHN